jgi:hypothetical protein
MSFKKKSPSPARYPEVSSSGRSSARTHSVICAPSRPAIAARSELAAYSLHLRVHIVEVVQQDRLGNHGQLGRAELVASVVAQHHVLDEHPQARRKIRQRFELLRSIMP